MKRRFLFDSGAPAPAAGGETLTLEKGARGPILDKAGAPLSDVHIGAGWDISAGNKADYDLDVFAICLGEGGKIPAGNVLSHCAYFGNKTLPGIQCGADNLTGQGDGDDENIHINFANVPAEVHEVIVGINIYRAASKNQNFGQVNNAFVRYAPKSDANATVKKYDLTEDYSSNTGVLAFRFYRKDSEWKYQALGEGTNGEIDAIAKKYQS